MSAVDAYAQKYLAADTFAAQLVGAEIESYAPGHAVCTLELSGKHKNGHGIVMGGVLFTLADFAFAVACDAMGSGFVTLQSSIQFLHAVQEGLLRAEAKCLRETKGTCFYEVTLSGGDGRVAAIVSITGYRRA